jgi:hypothetical protein
MKVSIFISDITVLTVKHAGLGLGTVCSIYVCHNLLEVCWL